MDRIGPYEVQAELGRGGMGVVLAARCPRTGRDVAVKVLNAALSGPDDPARFEREVQALVRLRHPGVVAVLDAGRGPTGPWLAMERVDGESLERRVARDGPLAPGEARLVGRALCDALAHAHAAGVLHRDVKPHNVLLARDGRVVLVDFGLARLLGRETRLSLSGEVVGTPAYLAPEQANGQEVGPAADVYGLGGTLYHALAGEPPLRGTSVVDLLRRVLTERPRPLHEARPGVPRGLSAAVMACLEKSPARRPSLVELRAALEAEPAAAGRGLAVAGAAGLVVVVVAAGAWLAPNPVPESGPTPAGPAPVASALPVLVVPEKRGPTRAAVEAIGREEYDRALALADEALALDPRDAVAHAVRAECLLHREDYHGALAASDAALALDPRDDDARWARAKALVALKEWAAALLACDAALPRNQGQVSWREVHAQALQSAGRLEEALAAWTAVIDLDPRHEAARFERGKLLLRHETLEDARRAAEDLRLAVSLRDEVGPWWLLATACLRTGEAAEAEAALTRVIALRPETAAAHVRRAELRMQAGRVAEAEADAVRAAELAPDGAAALNLRGVLAIMRGEPGEALPLLRRASQREPDNPAIAGNLVTALVQTGAAAEGKVLADQLVDRAPRRLNGHVARVRALVALGRHDEARAACDEARGVVAPEERAKLEDECGVLLRTP